MKVDDHRKWVGAAGAIFGFDGGSKETEPKVSRGVDGDVRGDDAVDGFFGG